MTFAFTLLNASAQETTVDFEEFGLSPGEFLNGSDGSGAFNTEFLILGNNFNESYQSWSGWAISATTDTETAGFVNQYSSITGAGVDGSNSYSVSFNFVPNPIDFLISTGEGPIVSHKGVFITNSTYTYLSMLNGDSFAKKFGGTDGTDPDYNLLTIRGENMDGEQDSVEFYLADYRFDNGDDDYIVDEWTYVDLSKFQYGPELTFGLTTTDIGVYGANTPAFFCMDNFVLDVVSSTENESFADLKIFPNPATDMISIDFKEKGQYKIINYNGKVVLANYITNNRIDISDLNSGVYNLVVSTEKGETTRRFVKI